MRFYVLRNMQVTYEGEALHVSSAYKPRLLLAILLSRAGRALSPDTLMSGLWQKDVPTSARRNLHQYIHRLRGALGAEALPRHSGSYALHVDPDLVDATRFQRLAAEGAEALANGDHAIAAKLLREGLNLWQGKAYEEFLECELVATDAARLEQARLVAYEQLADAELALGRPEPLVPMLTDLVRENPFEENLCGQLMRVLAMTGRQARALQVFRDTRKALTEQLGIEPGARLQAVHREILRGKEQVKR
jgi:DNA-binding SARP family transcriptional activator